MKPVFVYVVRACWYETNETSQGAYGRPGLERIKEPMNVVFQICAQDLHDSSRDAA